MTKRQDVAEAKGKCAKCQTCSLANRKELYFGGDFCLAPNAEIKEGNCSAYNPIPPKSPKS